jgi:hypothetical protein
LNSQSTHFLLEFLQNANDNKYPAGNIPKLEFEYRNGFLRVDCNEVGFLPKHVDAICQIGNSTKKGNHEMVGEKGIGFKSVFKVADVVYITSLNYSFKFDKNAEFGMIVPDWSDPPTGFTRRSGFTSFYLHIPSQRRQNEVLGALKTLDATILLFVQKLREVLVTIDGSRFINLQREDLDSNKSEVPRVRRLYQGQDLKDFIIIRQNINNMLVEEKRPQLVSEVQLGFPVGQDGKVIVLDQQVFAHLPLRR